ncbi:MAG: signal recognition particle-docking protein FtsY [Acidobacteria bacterium]|nr:MAG: signal recognition particle-docking protein FtsY [Acidobacteriota bacterium]
MKPFWKRRQSTDQTTNSLSEPSQTLLGKFRKAISSTRRNITERVQEVAGRKREIDAEVLESLEEALITADVGPRITLDILEKARQQVDRKALSDFGELKAFIASELTSILVQANAGERRDQVIEGSPHVILVVGVNGTGKTTTIGKLAYKFKSEGASVLLAGADTFRAAASDQLAIWAERAGVPLIQQQPGADPAAVVYDALKSAKTRNIDVVIVDTAGRLHTKIDLMQELQKIRRVAAREVPGAPHQVLLVIDAVTGQNGLEQARQFLRSIEVTGLILTKLDGTAKGGIVIAIAKELNLPIRYVGIGEGIEDLIEFSPELYVRSLFEDNGVTES